MLWLLWISSPHPAHSLHLSLCRGFCACWLLAEEVAVLPPDCEAADWKAAFRRCWVWVRLSRRRFRACWVWGGEAVQTVAVCPGLMTSDPDVSDHAGWESDSSCSSSGSSGGVRWVPAGGRSVVGRCRRTYHRRAGISPVGGLPHKADTRYPAHRAGDLPCTVPKSSGSSRNALPPPQSGRRKIRR